MYNLKNEAKHDSHKKLNEVEIIEIIIKKWPIEELQGSFCLPGAVLY
jgi:hypothetical protein